MHWALWEEHNAFLQDKTQQHVLSTILEFYYAVNIFASVFEVLSVDLCSSARIRQQLRVSGPSFAVCAQNQLHCLAHEERFLCPGKIVGGHWGSIA